jgi:hypothetical protein
VISVKQLKEILEELPDDALAYAYEGEVVGIIFVSADKKELGYIPTEARGSEDHEFIRTITI